MYYPTTGSSAYKPEISSPNEHKVKVNKTKQSTSVHTKKVRKIKKQYIIGVAVLFVLMFTMLNRYVQIYGKHDLIAQKTKQFDELKMANDQLSVEIKSLTDSSRIEQYAMEKLNLKKMDSNQIVYLSQSTEDNMQKIAHNKKSIFGGFFGLFSGVLEYLK